MTQTGRSWTSCGPSEVFDEPFEAHGYVFQTWRCACGRGINGQVEPVDLLTGFAREHLSVAAASDQTL